jgi:hypothetical protein
MRASLFPVFLTLACLFSGAASHGAISGADDFDDNLKDQEKWSTDRASGSGLLSEAGGRLEYTSAATHAIQYSYRPWKLNKATYDTNWEIIVDLSNHANPAAGKSASMGIEVFAAFSNFTKSVYLELYSTKEGSLPVEQGMESYMVDGENYSGGVNVGGGPEGSVRLTFNAVDKVFTFYRDPDGAANGYTWTKHASYGIAGSGGSNANASWGLSGSDELMVNLYGYSNQFAVPQGTVYADNFSAASGTSVTTVQPSSPANDSITLNASVFPNGLDTSAAFQIARDASFANFETTTPESIPGDSSGTSVSAVLDDLVPGANYWVRAVATNDAGVFVGNVVTFTAPPFTLTIDPTIGSVNRNVVSETYPAGSSVTLTATPPDGSTFFGWSGDISGTQNPITIQMTRNLHVRANYTVPINQAVDSSLTFTTGGGKPWFGQTTVSHDGSAAARSGAIGDGESSWFQTVLIGTGQISFWVKTSSESGDVFEFFIDNVRQPDSVGGTLDWQKRTYQLGPGTHTLRWQYRKDIFLYAGDDAVWVDQIVFTPTLDFAAWRTSKFTSVELNNSAISGAGADPDGDGASNLLEFALGGDPKDPGSRPAPAWGIEEISGERYLTMTVNKPAGILGITYLPQVSGSLDGWSGGSPNVVVMIDTATTLKVRDASPMGTSAKRFMRLMVGN